MIRNSTLMSAICRRRFCALMTSVAFVPVITPTSAVAAEATPKYVIVSPVGEAFQAQIEAVWRALPAPLVSRLQASGWRIELAEFVVDAAPELASAAPRGWPAGMSWRQTDAVHLPRSRKVVLAEKRLTRAGQVVKCERVGGVMRHELGHAYDLAEGRRDKFLSSSGAFRQVYEQDLQKLSGEQRAQLSYYLQSAQAGRQETFAECFATVLGGGSDEVQAAEFATGFPRSLVWMRRKLALPATPTSAAVAAAQTAGTRR